MVALTTRQRDILKILLNASTPLGAAELADQTQLTARQVNYNLDGVNRWLSQRQVALKVTPGVGIELACPPDKSSALIQELSFETPVQLILSPGQRRQLLALILLFEQDPLILQHLKQLLQVSRATVVKDADRVAAWLQSIDLDLIRRPNFGVLVEGTEKDRRKALALLLWGEIPFGESLFSISHSDGLVFLSGTDAELMPSVKRANEIILGLDVQRTFGQVAYAETQLGGRFTDDAVLYLGLVLAIQAARVQSGNVLEIEAETLAWFKGLPIWQVAEQIGKRLAWRLNIDWPESEVASISMHLLAAPRNERWPGDLELDGSFKLLIDEILQGVADAYGMPSLGQDRTLRDGIVNHIVPACMRQRFLLWLPAPPEATTLSDRYSIERELARNLGELVEKRVGVALPGSEINNLALLLRASFIRERPNQIRQVFVVCPSGMATAQLLVARLKANFPRMETLKVVSVRELTSGSADHADLIITTVPLPIELQEKFAVIQVHPLLLPEDVKSITDYLA